MATNEITIGAIGGGKDSTTQKVVETFLAQADRSKQITVKFHSEGGSVFDGFAIYEAFKNYAGPKKALIQSSAMSIASYIVMAFDEIEIAPNGYLMMHNPYSTTEGDAEDHAKAADLLGKLKTSMLHAYCERSGKSEAEVQAILDKETYLNATEALEEGFVTSISDRTILNRPSAQAKIKMPQRVYASLFGAGGDGEQKPTGEDPMSTQQPAAATITEIEKAYPKAKAEFVLKCVKKELPMASVAAAAAEEMMAENEKLVTENTTLKEENERLKAKAKTEGEEEPKNEGEEEEEKKKEPVSKIGVKPLAKAKGTSPGVSARDQWNEAVETAAKKPGMTRAKAVCAANKAHPGLRERMLEEAKAS